MVYEEWDFILSLYFAVSALSTAGLQTPSCVGADLEKCHLPDRHGAYLGLYLMIGVPLYAITLAQFSSK